MAQPPPDGAEPVHDRLAWFACAFPLSRLPVVGSEAYYFPRGHQEQCPDPLPAPLASSGSGCTFPCTVAAVELFADPLFADGKTDEPFATISLLPVPAHRRHPAPTDEPEPEPADAAALTYCGKQLSNRDSCGSSLFVPKVCADLVLPALGFGADDNVAAQSLEMRDLRGNSWAFRHTCRPMRKGSRPRANFLAGWSKFVNKMALHTGDTAVFMRRPDGELLIGVRRVPHVMRARVPPQEVEEAVALATEGKPFTVRYYPRQGTGEFVVPRREVEAAIAMDWKEGVQVRMKVVSPEDPRRSDTATGVVNSVNRTTIWRMLQIHWVSDPMEFPKSTHVNPWQVQMCLGQGANAPTDVSSSSSTMCTGSTSTANLPKIVDPPIDGLREIFNSENTDSNSSSIRTIRLFGTNIVARAPSAATAIPSSSLQLQTPCSSSTTAASQHQGDHLPNVGVAGTEDASATSPSHHQHPDQDDDATSLK